MLNQQQLKKNLKDDIKKIEDKLYKSLNDQSKGIYNVHKILDKKMGDEAPTQDFNLDEYKDKIWKQISEEWSKMLAKQLIETLSEELSDLVSKRMTDYIKSATITIPPGSVVNTTVTASGAPTVGTVVANSPAANIN
jgi:hypothetical protein